MIDTPSSLSLAQVSERELRRRIDRSIARALVDAEFARRLLADPTVVLEDRGCPPQQYRSLRTIKAATLRDFAFQAKRLFWSVDLEPVLEEHEWPRVVVAEPYTLVRQSL